MTGRSRSFARRGPRCSWPRALAFYAGALAMFLAATAAALVWYLAHAHQSSRWPGGSSLPGLVFGVAAALIFVFEFLLWPRRPLENLNRHDGELGKRAVGIDADERIFGDAADRNPALQSKLMAIADDAQKPALDERREVDDRVVDAVAHCHGLAPTQQEIVNRLLDLEDVDVDRQLGKGAAQPDDCPRHHDIGDARDRGDTQLLSLARSDPLDRKLQILDLAVDSIQVVEDVAGFRGWHIAALTAIEQPDTELRTAIPRQAKATSFLQSAPSPRRWLRYYLPLMPLAIEQLDVSGYDLVISSSHAAAKGVIVSPDARGRGAGARLVKYAVDFAASEGCGRITLLTDPDNEEAHRFYRRCGFTRSDMVVFRKLIGPCK